MPMPEASMVRILLMGLPSKDIKTSSGWVLRCSAFSVGMRTIARAFGFAAKSSAKAASICRFAFSSAGLQSAGTPKCTNSTPASPAIFTCEPNTGILLSDKFRYGLRTYAIKSIFDGTSVFARTCTRYFTPFFSEKHLMWNTSLSNVASFCFFVIRKTGMPSRTSFCIATSGCGRISLGNSHESLDLS